MENQINLSQIKSALFGVAVGDALGVPVEFKSRSILKNNPVHEMLGYGTHNQPKGSFSDDTSLTLCLAEALTKDFDLEEIAHYFLRWYHEGFWTANGNVFDIGNATLDALFRIKQGQPAYKTGGRDEMSNGNGSLMRILPLVFYINTKSIDEKFDICRKVSSITHGHIRSVLACFYYLEFAKIALTGMDKLDIYHLLKKTIPSYLSTKSISKTEISNFNRLLKEDIYMLESEDIQSSGYVLHTLEASIWCILRTSNFKEAVLTAVNLGEDTDTTGAVTGGLAALLYGFDSIPIEWIEVIARKSDIENLAERLYAKLM